MKIPALLALYVLMLGVSSAASAVPMPTCAADAAEEFGIAKKPFAALVMQARTRPMSVKVLKARGEFGPMRLTQQAVDFAAQENGIPAELIKEDRCLNYFAAAWWYSMATAQADNLKKPDTWAAVKYYLSNVRVGYGDFMVDETRRIYETLGPRPITPVESTATEPRACAVDIEAGGKDTIADLNEKAN